MTAMAVMTTMTMTMANMRKLDVVHKQFGG